MIDAVDQLVVPPSDGLFLVHYPFTAVAVRAPSPIPLDPSLSRALDRLFGTAP
jgi:hypothetical protein